MTLAVILAAVAVLGGWAGARMAARADLGKLHASFTILLLLVALHTAWEAVPALA